ncbi:MAG: DUF5677 domain-containing protein [Acidobacteriota bacterium]
MSERIFGEAGSKARTYIPMRHPAHVALLYAALDLVEEILAKLTQQEHDKRTILAAALFVRMREFAKAASELLLYGQQNAASVQLRAVFEVLVYLKNCCERPEFEAEFSGATWKNLRQMAQVGIDNPSRFLSEAEAEKWAERKRQAEASMSGSEAPRLSLEALARKVGLEAWYAYFYRMSSHHAHSTFVSLVLRHLEIGAEGSMKIDASPKDTEFRMLSGTLAEYIIIATEAVLGLYNLEATKGLVGLRQQHQELTEKDIAHMRASVASGTGSAA